MSEDGKTWLPCPYLGEDVVLTPERRAHILEEHSEVLEEGEEDLKAALLQPDQVRQRPTGSLLFVINIGRVYLVVAVNRLKREKVYKVMTAYFTQKLSGEDKVLWERSK